MKATEEYIPKVLFIMLHEVALTLDHSNESYWRVLFCDTVILLYKVVRINSSRVIIKMKETKNNIQVLK